MKASKVKSSQPGKLGGRAERCGGPIPGGGGSSCESLLVTCLRVVQVLKKGQCDEDHRLSLVW